MKASRARHLIKDNQATPFFNMGIFSIKLKKEAKEELQPIAVGIDSGSKKEAYSLLSKANHYLNIQCDAVYWVKDKMKSRAEMRRNRRSRKTPCRPLRWANRASAKNRLAPSTKARNQLRLNIIKKLKRIYPISHCRLENISFTTVKGKGRRDNGNFSPLMVGKKWLREELIKLDLKVSCNPGMETKKLRTHYKLFKIKDKMSPKFEAHVVDSAVMAANCVGAKVADKNKDILYLKPILFNRRQLHKCQPAKGGIRGKVGAMNNGYFTGGSIIKLLKPTKSTLKSNPKSIFLMGGSDKNGRLSLSSLVDKCDRVIRTVNKKDIKFLSYNKFTIKYK